MNQSFLNFRLYPFLHMSRGTIKDRKGKEDDDAAHISEHVFVVWFFLLSALRFQSLTKQNTEKV